MANYGTREQQVVDAVLDGTRPALEAYVELCAELKQLEDNIAQIKQLAIDEFYSHWGGESKQIGAYIVQKHPGRATYDYSGNEQWANKKAMLTAIEKNMQISAKRVLEGKPPLVDEDTGEIFPPAGVKKSNDTISLKSAY